ANPAMYAPPTEPAVTAGSFPSGAGWVRETSHLAQCHKPVEQAVYVGHRKELRIPFFVDPEPFYSFRHLLVCQHAMSYGDCDPHQFDIHHVTRQDGLVASEKFSA